ncbi:MULTISPECIES: type II CAAX endopeptidase family protein [unclassified Saccharopolyspora]|uniref:CPBP family intramembrane glutamic endopeptidase n=1 Tax=unclassified Saccharopolyspora TaxID=2646250 RepID=UPI0027E15AD6|nr:MULTISPECIES: type II CAAX endopeptidase family protein [unclassified Saccharopolyspora]
MQVPQPEPAEGASAADGGTGTATKIPTPSAERDHRWGFGAFFLAEAVFILASVTLAALFGNPRESAWFSTALVCMLMLPTLVSAAVAVVITQVRGNGPRLDFGLHWRWEDVKTGFGIGLIGLLSTTVASMVWINWVGPENATSTVSSLLDGVQLSPSLAVLIFLHVWLIAPVCEEVLYRGLLWGAMERLRWSRISAFVLSTAVFAIGHLEPERTWLLLIIAIPIGVARMRTGRLTASVVAHQVNNFLPALGLLLISLGVVPAS